MPNHPAQPHAPRVPRVVLAVITGAAVVASVVVVALAAPSGAPAAANTTATPTACTRIIDGVEWRLDPCINEGDPLPPDFVEVLEDMAACPTPSPSPGTPTPAPTRTEAAARPGQAVTTATTTVVPSEPPSPTPTPTEPTPSPSDDPPQCPVFTDPQPWPGYPPPGSPPPPSPDPTLSPEPSPDCTEPSPPGVQAEPKDQSADLVKCRKKTELPDPDKPVTLIAAGNSLVSAHNQTGFGVGTCDHTTADHRGMKGNDGMFSFAGKYYNDNKQIAEYYNFARTGYGTEEVRSATPRNDSCGNAWNRTKSQLALSVDVATAAKAKGHAVYFTADGGVNNTNWTDVVKQLGQCTGWEFALNNLITAAAFVGIQVSFFWKVPKVAATDPPNGLKQNIIKKGGQCYASVRWAGFTLWSTRVDVPRYNGPNSGAEDDHVKAIQTDITDIIDKLLNAKVDKIVWMLYFNINPAKLDVANLGLAYAKSELPAIIANRLPNSVWEYLWPLVDPIFKDEVDTMTKDLNDRIKSGIKADPKVAWVDPGALGTDDIQKTGVGGCPHPNDAGHVKLKDKLKAKYDAM